MVTVREAGAFTVGATLGTAQTPLLRKYIDEKYPGKRIEALKGFGTPSALGGILSGILTAGVGILGAQGKGPVNGRSEIQAALIGHGIPALIGGIFSGIWPAITITTSAAPAQFVPQRIVAPPARVPPVVVTAPEQQVITV